eukprot:4747485-Pyramimonas_sp.AAC.1
MAHESLAIVSGFSHGRALLPRYCSPRAGAVIHDPATRAAGWQRARRRGKQRRYSEEESMTTPVAQARANRP